MSGNVIGLGEARAFREGDCTKWTVLECARAFVRDLENGDIEASAVLIDFIEDRPNDERQIESYRAGLSRDQEIAIRTYRLHSLTLSSLGK